MRTSAFLLFALLASTMVAAEVSPVIEVSAGKVDRTGQPIRVPIVLPANFQATDAKVSIDGAKLIVAQVTKPSLLSKPEQPAAGQQNAELVFIAPEFKAGQTLRGKATITDQAKDETPTNFWNDAPGEHMDLMLGGKPVLRYMYAKGFLR